MSVNEELEEQVEHAKEPFERMVAVSMATIAALLAIVSVAGHILTTDELLAQQKASDQWAFYQAKAIRRYESDIARDILAAVSAGQNGVQKYAANLTRYEKEANEIQGEAQTLETESHVRGRQALRAHFGEVFLEIGIVLASLAILTKRKDVWYIAMLSSAGGLATAATALFIR
jgi:uncharacterized membrane protein YcjF (UPF0283 family)